MKRIPARPLPLRAGLLVAVLVLAAACKDNSGPAQAAQNAGKRQDASDSASAVRSEDPAGILSFTVDLKKQELRLYWKDENGARYGSLGKLKAALQRDGQRLLFAMNGGMYSPAFAPQGLYIENGKTLARLDKNKGGGGNFYLKPNGVFYVTAHGKGVVCRTETFRSSPQVRYATQSGPLLLIDGKLHPAFTKGSANVNIRNGVGILQDGRVLFAMSRTPVNFYDFASWFQKQGCADALYLDGAVSRTYLPERRWLQTGGDFGVIIGVTERAAL